MADRARVARREYLRVGRVLRKDRLRVAGVESRDELADVFLRLLLERGAVGRLLATGERDQTRREDRGRLQDAHVWSPLNSMRALAGAAGARVASYSSRGNPCAT